MAAVQERQAFPRQLPEPGVKGERPVPQVEIELLVRFGQDFLDDIRRINAGREAAQIRARFAVLLLL